MRAFSANTDNRALLLRALFENEIKSIVAHFDGQNDSGSINTIEAVSVDDETEITDDTLCSVYLRGVTPAGETLTNSWDNGTYSRRNFEQKPLSLFELIENVCYETLEVAHGGWEINAGSFGKIYIDVPLGGKELSGQSAILIDYNEYEEDYSDYDDEEYNDE